MLNRDRLRVTQFSTQKLSTKQEPELQGRKEPMEKLVKNEEREHTDLANLLWTRVALDVDEAVSLFINVCDRVAQYHDRDVVIGELNPDRIKLTMHNERITEVKIPVKGGRSSPDTLALGSSRYVSPEIVRGGRPSVQADIYSIGVMMHIAIKGVPIENKSCLQRFNLLAKTPNYENAVDTKLEKILSKCVDKDLQNRYGSVAELKADLISLREGRVLVGGLGTKRNNRLKVNRNFRGRKMAVNVAILLLLVLIGPLTALCNPPRSLAVGQVPATVDTVWNKPGHKYNNGDLFSITIVPKSKSYVYLFYIDDKDSVLALFPACNQKDNLVVPEKPLKIDSLADCCFRVDSRDGKIVVVLVEESEGGKALKDKVLSTKDWMDMSNTTSKLKVTGRQLLARVNSLSKKHANYISHVVEDAPKATPHPGSK